MNGKLAVPKPYLSQITLCRRDFCFILSVLNTLVSLKQKLLFGRIRLFVVLFLYILLEIFLQKHTIYYMNVVLAKIC